MSALQVTANNQHCHSRRRPGTTRPLAAIPYITGMRAHTWNVLTKVGESPHCPGVRVVVRVAGEGRVVMAYLCGAWSPSLGA